MSEAFRQGFQDLSTVRSMTPKTSSAWTPIGVLLLDVVKANPGITLGKVRKQTSLGWGTLYDHVGKLEKEGKLESKAAGRRRLLFPAGRMNADDVSARALVEGETARRIAVGILSSPRISFKELVAVTGESERVVYYHVKRLLKAGLVTSTSRTRHRGLTAGSRLLEHLSAVNAQTVTR